MKFWHEVQNHKPKVRQVLHSDLRNNLKGLTFNHIVNARKFLLYGLPLLVRQSMDPDHWPLAKLCCQMANVSCLLIT